MNRFFGSIGAIQIIVYQNLCNIQHPANSYHFNRIVRTVVDFDILDPEWTTKYLMNFDYDEIIGNKQDQLGDQAILNYNFKDNEYDTFNPILNLGGNFMIIIYGILCLLLIELLIIIKKVKELRCKRLNMWFKKNLRCKYGLIDLISYLKEILFYGFFIRLT